MPVTRSQTRVVLAEIVNLPVTYPNRRLAGGRATQAVSPAADSMTILPPIRASESPAPTVSQHISATPSTSPLSLARVLASVPPLLQLNPLLSRTPELPHPSVHQRVFTFVVVYHRSVGVWTEQYNTIRAGLLSFAARYIEEVARLDEVDDQTLIDMMLHIGEYLCVYDMALFVPYRKI